MRHRVERGRGRERNALTADAARPSLLSLLAASVDSLPFSFFHHIAPPQVPSSASVCLQYFPSIFTS